MRRWQRLLVGLARCCLTVVVPAAGPRSTVGPTGPPAQRPADCGPDDRPEPGVSGQVPLRDQLSGRAKDGYSCNLRWVGGNRLAGGDTQMTWYGTCAYRVVPPPPGAASDAVAVLDVRDPSKPKQTRTLIEPQWAGQGGVLNVHEGIHASEASGLLVVPAGRFVTTYDVRTDCRRPRRLSTFDTGLAPDPISQSGLSAVFHSGQLSPDGTFFYGTTTGVESFLAPLGPCLTVVDLLDPAHPKVVTRWGADFPCHDLGFDTTGNRAYVGTYAPLVGHPAAVVGRVHAVGSALQGAHRDDGGRHERDPGSSPGRPHRAPRSPRRGRPAHRDVRPHRRPPLRDRRGGGHLPRRQRPHRRRERSRPPEAGQQDHARRERAPRLRGHRAEGERQENLLLYTSHYVSVDDPNDATLAFFSWYSSGLRVFDIRDPRHPVEIAYFNPPVGAGSQRLHDSTSTYPRYVPETGQIWVGSAVNAFWVVELDPSLRPEALRGGPPVAWSSQARRDGPSRRYLSTPVPERVAQQYCTLL